MESRSFERDYEAMDLIIDGAFSHVRRCRHRLSGKMAVTKELCNTKLMPHEFLSSKKNGKMVPTEIWLLEVMHHPNIVKFFEYYETTLGYQMVMEYRPDSTDLFEFLGTDPKLDDMLLCFIFRQVVEAVNHLHSMGFCHGDLKDENVVLDQNFRCMLIDFGSAFPSDSLVTQETLRTTYIYMCPELIRGDSCSGVPAEMWQLGVLLYRLCAPNLPFFTGIQSMDKTPELPEQASSGAKHLLSWLLAADPSNRAGLSEVLEHWWTNQNVPIENYHWDQLYQESDKGTDSPPSSTVTPEIPTTIRKTDFDNNIVARELLAQLDDMTSM
ncbi:unnamed protein product, partial [Mesorhabditis spiculigera]